ncbi:MAG: ABC transporter permease [Anaerolineae bacterium]|nr:ABC transporter permease [Anaerolineae bacterium]MDW8069958.1 ABC transporter permease [Anaerolineae bacterium]
MTRYVINRLLMAVPVVFGVLFITFALARVIPGDPCRAILGEKATDAVCEKFIKDKGLDQPIPVQFAVYLKEIAQGDFGVSLRTKQAVTEMIIERLPQTIELTVAAMLFASTLGIFLGMIAAYWANSKVDVAVMIGANIGVSMPVFWLGLMLAYIFALLLKDTPFWLPPSGRLSSGITVANLPQLWGIEPGHGLYGIVSFISNLVILNALITGNWTALSDALKHLILPAVALGTIPMSIIARMTRSSLLEVLGLDYIRTARAKGLREIWVIFRHAMSNAMLPVVTVIGLSLGSLLSGAVLTETIFGLSGVGRIMYDSITARDYGVVQGFVVVIAMIYVLVNLAVDLSYAVLDPRIRLD